MGLRGFLRRSFKVFPSLAGGVLFRVMGCDQDVGGFSYGRQATSGTMQWSLKIGRLFGIEVFLHFTFLLLLLFLGLVFWQDTASLPAALRGVAFIVALFGCVLLHELGHALMARRYGIETRDITLLPIGGLARLERMPEKPMQEFWVALAGPAVNVVIAAVLYGWLAATGGLVALEGISLTGEASLQRLMMVNVFLVVFNLLPAFPMDGGRVLRSLLALGLGRRRATAIAARVGQGMAIVFGILGFITPNPFLVFIAIFVYLGAQAEASVTELQSALKDLEVRDAMMTRFRTLTATDSLARAVDELLAGSQQDFPVVAEGRPVGILRRNELVKALSTGRGTATVGEAMGSGCPVVQEGDALRTVVESMHAQQCSSIPVVREGQIVGLLTLENVSEMMMVNSALDKTGRANG